ncbi:MAG TPA: hypothetical protein VFE37_01240 [Chloroflexota bacterium]|nr:hypothetical protein [Chloroflexota bacterium]
MRCSFPRCFREAATRCATCRQVYCTRHCGDRVFESGRRVAECDLCDPTAPPVDPAPPPLLATLAAAGAVALFLAVVSLGIAIDVTVRGQGFVALWVFAGAFVALVAHLGH